MSGDQNLKQPFPGVVGKQALRQGHLDPLAETARLAFDQGREDPVERQLGGTETAVRRGDERRTLTTSQVPERRQTAEFGHDDRLICPQTRPRMFPTESRDRCVDQARIEGSKVRITHTEALSHPRAPRVDHHVRLPTELGQLGAAFRRGKVENATVLAPAPKRPSRLRSQDVTARLLDECHVRTEIGQKAGGHRAGESCRGVNHDQTVEGSSSLIGRHRLPPKSVGHEFASGSDLSRSTIQPERASR